MIETMTLAPNHSEARTLKVRFRHLHRPTDRFHVRTMSGYSVAEEYMELGGTLVAQNVGYDEVDVSMVVVNPKDAHPPRQCLTPEVLGLLAQCLAPADLGPVLSRAYRLSHPTPEPITRKSGRQRAWDRLQSGKKVRISLHQFKTQLADKSLVPFLGKLLGLPESGLQGLR